MGMSKEDTPTWGKDTLPSQRVPQKILKKSFSLYYKWLYDYTGMGQDVGSGRTRIILPGEDGGQPRVLVPGGDVGNDPKCVVRMTNLNESSGSCALCSRTR